MNLPLWGKEYEIDYKLSIEEKYKAYDRKNL